MAGTPELYTGEAINPKHLSPFEMFFFGWHRNYKRDPKLVYKNPCSSEDEDPCCEGCDCHGCHNCASDECCIMLQQGEFVHEDDIALQKKEELEMSPLHNYDIRAQMAAPAILA